MDINNFNLILDSIEYAIITDANTPKVTVLAF